MRTDGLKAQRPGTDQFECRQQGAAFYVRQRSDGAFRGAFHAADSLIASAQTKTIRFAAITGLACSKLRYIRDEATIAAERRSDSQVREWSSRRLANNFWWHEAEGSGHHDCALQAKSECRRSTRADRNFLRGLGQPGNRRPNRWG